MVHVTKTIHEGREFEIWEGVYEPAEDSFMLLAEALHHSPSRALEIGTGCGLIAISLSKAGYPSVLATDVSATAIRCARANAKRLSAEVRFLLGDLLSPLRGSFDLILFNPPYLPVDRGGLEEQSWAGGSKGREVVDRFLCQIDERLSPDGLALFVQSSHNDLSATEKMAAREGFGVSILSREQFFFETLHVIGLRRNSHLDGGP